MVIKRLFLVILFFLSINTAFGGIDFEYRCHDPDCLEGTLIDYSVIVKNNLNKTIDIDSIYFRNLPDNSILDYDVREPVTLEPNEKFFFNFTRELKAAWYGYTYYFVPCFDVRRDLDGQMTTSEFCAELIETISVFPLAAIECNENTDCKSREFCSSRRCVNVYCEEGVAENHECVETSCNFFQKEDGKNCVFDNSKTSFPLLGLAIILILFYFYRKKN